MAGIYTSSLKITLDAHIDAPWIMQKYGKFDFKEGRSESKLSLEKCRAGGLNSAIFALYLSDDKQDALGPDGTREAIDKQIAWLKADPNIEVVGERSKAIKAIANGKFPVFLGLEGGRLINESLIRLKDLFESTNLTYLTLCHNRNTSWADSATDVPYHGGLSKFGVGVVRKCAELGIMIDVSHASDKTVMSAMFACQYGGRLIATHSGCRSLVNHPRNLSNELINVIVKSKGIICIPFARNFVGPTIKDMIHHIDHIAQMVGVDYVGIGSDLDGAAMIDGINDASDWGKIANELSIAGYGETSIGKICGGNLLRFLD